MKINKSRLYVASYQSKSEIVDEWGNKTGEYDRTYTVPTEFYAYVSPAKGEANTRRFGEMISYDKVIVVDNEAPFIDELSILWVDTMPEFDSLGNLKKGLDGEVITPHDYIVKKVARSLNSSIIAIRKVNVSE
ncbi:MAG: hypothetical protein IK072_01910 [Clostridia bacterium]|nr:hypothetical protein [Clostridia bacterium]